MKINKTILTPLYKLAAIALYALFFTSCSSENNQSIKKPPLQEPKYTYVQQNSVIQIPITIDTAEIKKAILSEIKNPISTGSTDKVKVDIFASDKISKKEFIDILEERTRSGYYTDKYKEIKNDFSKIITEPFNLWTKPAEAAYKYKSEDIADFLEKNFKAGAWVTHKIYLKDLNIFFEGSTVKIFTSYKIDISLNYEQNLLPKKELAELKGLLTGSIEADISLKGQILIDDNAQIKIKAYEDETKLEFTKIELPTSIDALDILEITQTESFLTKRILEEPINKYTFYQIQKQISKKQVDIQLAKKIQNLVSANSIPVELSKDLWLVPQPSKISISQLDGQGEMCENTLSINIGITAKPKLVTSSSEPIVAQCKPLPIVCERLSPKVYLYPILNIKYDFVEKTIEQELKSFIDNENLNSEYSVSNVNIYPSNKKLVIAIDLIERKNSKKVVTFYLWGTPKLNHNLMYVGLENLDYTLESKNHLLNTASWLLNSNIRDFIQEKAVFSYQKEFVKLSKKLSNIEYESIKNIINGEIKLNGIQDIHTSKESLIVQVLAQGDISYKINLGK